MATVDELPAVKRGLWWYAGTSPCDVRIVHHHTLYGSGDADDPPELASDRQVDCFYVRYHTPAAAPAWLDGGCALSLREAMFLAERKLGPVVSWQD
ncbi:MAG TPA: hypothetical protein PKC60_13030 [Hydrogenophaga sp.]|uniref:hypothetical protein n=1 Tax=Hydrogenophaga sp. TaxID=1904254 RepID=UPI002BE7BB24|nr:hypothetical protein [Hydrogenophaga sp.]HMN94147.1 hypothetical protein [Hydrogenophaga sp.]HMP09606.1 hypothetical protein [Hydrogenophaga sp.]